MSDSGFDIQLSVISYQLSVISYKNSDIDYVGQANRLSNKIYEMYLFNVKIIVICVVKKNRIFIDFQSEFEPIKNSFVH
ncbi:hypothetical protein BGS_1160 [Beggiatoa sp. SS]|nr:hypothetical protein BGS_1160 [Beggiatoa sp. SS]